MLEHFQKQTPLRGLTAYSTISSQIIRFKNAGWHAVDINDLWSLWQDPKFAMPERLELDSVEPFDEWEELALFAGHYFVLLAVSSAPFQNPSKPTFNYEIPYDISPSVEVRSNVNHRGQGLRRFGAIVMVNTNTIAFHGGLTSNAKQSDCDVYVRTAQLSLFNAPPENIMCHTITKLDSDSMLLVGGRNSPAKASSHCWIRKNGTWTQTQDLQPARYRHCSVAAKVGDLSGVLVFGGRTSDGRVLDDWSFFDCESGWQKVEITRLAPPPLFGAVITVTGESSGILVGGMSQVGILHAQFTTWELIKKKDGLSIRFESKLPRLNEVGIPSPATLRFGASLVPSRWGLLLIGGIGSRGPIPLNEEILVLRKYGRMDKFDQLFSSEQARPLLVGCGAVTVEDNNVLVVGGSAVCFSFGAFWNEKSYLLCPSEEDPSSPSWSVAVASNTAAESNGQSPGEPNDIASLELSVQHLEETQALNHATPPSNVSLRSAEDFQTLLAQEKPVVIKEIGLGPCTKLWTSEYLKDKIGPNRPVVVHAASTQYLSFCSKNFTYETQPFSEFITAAESGSHVYLRAISSSQPNKLPANLKKDFPEIANDFTVPLQLHYAVENEHSSVLRISGKTTMWLHYDVMANILCQIRGSKRVVLFPPSDISSLQFPAGETTSNLPIFTAEEDSLRNTRPVETILREGEVLFIPACWPHATAPTGEGLSVAVNVFFRGLEGGYAAGRDVYGNRDLEVYVNGRRDIGRIVKIFEKHAENDVKQEVERLCLVLREGKGFAAGERSKGTKEVERIVRSMDGLPEGIRGFYLRRLSDELLGGVFGRESR
jgi:tRNA wybutosine-synthesizing protein 4